MVSRGGGWFFSTTSLTSFGEVALGLFGVWIGSGVCGPGVASPSERISTSSGSPPFACSSLVGRVAVLPDDDDGPARFGVDVLGLNWG